VTLNKWLPFLTACLSVMFGSCLQGAEGVPPLTPTGLTVSYDSAHGIALVQWKKLQSSDLAGYLLYRENGDGTSLNPQLLDTIIDDTSFADKLFHNLRTTEDRTVTYRLKALDLDANPSLGYSKPATLHAISPRRWREIHGDTIFFPDTLSFYKIRFLNQDTGLATTQSGILYITQNGGRNWSYWSNAFSATSQRKVTVFHAENLTTVFIASSDYEAIRKTTNSGNTWTSLSDNARGGGMAFPGGDTIYAASSTKFLKSTNGGSNWTKYDYPVSSLTCPNSLTCYALPSTVYDHSNSSVLKTTNGAATWDTLAGMGQLGVSESAKIYCPTVDKCFRSKTSAYTEVTTDGGVQWSTSTPYYLDVVVFTDLITGHALGNPGRLLKTTNAGITWTTTQIPWFEDHSIEDFYFPTSQIGYAAGVGFLLKTTDGGTTWDPL
jgi:hypothetical protein